MPVITSQYPGRCKSCGTRFVAGARIFWSKPTGALCLKCGEGNSGDAKQENAPKPKPARGTSGTAQTATVTGKESYFSIDWSELKKLVSRSVVDSDTSWLKRNFNSEKVKKNSQDVSSWHGYSRNDLKQWLRDGYKSTAIENLGDFSPPLRDKRHYIYAEDGEEIFVDRVLSGEDNYMGDWTKRDRIPGVAIEAEVMFAASVRAEVVNAYNAWLCKAVFALESAGIDCQVTMKFSSYEAVKSGEWAHTTVRVKQENETADFTTFSPMLSPAALRTFGFAAMIMHADSRDKDVDFGLGRGRPGKNEWACTWDNERRVLTIDCPYQPTSFPTDDMDNRFRAALREMKS